MKLPNNTVTDKNGLKEIVSEIVDILSLDGDDEECNQIINCLLESGRQSLTKYEEYITPKIYKEIMIGYNSQLVSSLKKYFERLWEIEYGTSNEWFISFLENYKIKYADVYHCVLNRSVDFGNTYMKTCPLLSIVLQLIFEDIDDDCLKIKTIFDELWFTVTNNGLRSIEKYSEYIVKSVYEQQLKIPSPLFKALREYFRPNLFLLLKEIKIRERNNLYESILDSVAEYGWLTDLKTVEDNLPPKSLKLLLEKLSSFHQKQKSQGNNSEKVKEDCSTTNKDESNVEENLDDNDDYIEIQNGEKISATEALERERAQFDAYINEHGVSGYADFLTARLHEWKKQIVRLVLIGSSGQGKSTLINTIRGLTVSDPEAASVDIIECTNTVNEYSDPKNPNLVYYDFPGVGTPKFPRDKYFENIQKVTKDNVDVKQYDFFLIISADRFTENDVWIAEQLHCMKKPFYFIRTKIDQCLENQKRNYPKDYDEKKTLQKIRDNCRTRLEEMQVDKTNGLNIRILKVFLISGRLDYTGKWDFPLMIKSLAEDLPFIQRHAIIYSIHNFSKEMIKQKADSLRNNVWKMAMASGFCGTIPIPFFSVLPDYYIINRHTTYFKETLGLDEESLKKIAEIHGCTFEQLSNYMLLSRWSKFFQYGLLSSASAASLATDATGEGIKTATREGIKTATGEGIKIATGEGIKIATEQGFIDLTGNIIKTGGANIIRGGGGCTSSPILRSVWEAGGTFIGEYNNVLIRKSTNTVVKESANVIFKESANTIVKESAVTVTDFVPVIGSIIGCTVNYHSMKYRLNKLIDEMEQAAYAVLEFAKNSSMSSGDCWQLPYFEYLF